MFVLDSEVTGEVLENGVVRKVKGYLDDLMLVELHWKAGQEGALHTHPHRQCTYVLSGAFESNVEGAKQVLRAGDCVYTAGGQLHGLLALEDGAILDVFTPVREDFLK
ncbi:MAG: cupin domain-containing protein [Clostridiaceae bacterium]|nr:cupin domain-containing protein [Clostridiaceae bacterium]NBI81560.1 cupin domain-containing protein [Clostridiaceae bacterium]RKJ80042.1 cupin domain-containing protein [Butyricicoccus sp. 1XD8-22]